MDPSKSIQIGAGKGNGMQHTASLEIRSWGHKRRMSDMQLKLEAPGVEKQSNVLHLLSPSEESNILYLEKESNIFIFSAPPIP